MSDNPYQASSAHEEFALATELPYVKKPKAALVVQISLLIFAIAIAIGFYVFVTRVVNHQVLGASTGNVTLDIALRLAVVALPIVAIVAVEKRMPLGRILGLLWIVFLIVFFLFTQYLGTKIHVPRDDSFAYIVGVYFGRILILSILGYWAYAFAFTKSARAFFR